MHDARVAVDAREVGLEQAEAGAQVGTASAQLLVGEPVEQELRTRSTSSVASKGLDTKSCAPLARARSMVECELSAKTTTTGRKVPPACRRMTESTSNPSMPGIRRSSSTRSGS